MPDKQAGTAPTNLRQDHERSWTVFVSGVHEKDRTAIDSTGLRATLVPAREVEVVPDLPFHGYRFE